jgi:hypothetical protein
VVALRAIFKAWNQNTPNVAANLPGWNDSYGFPYCFVDVPWKGVLCLHYVDPNNITTSNSISNFAVVVGL